MRVEARNARTACALREEFRAGAPHAKQPLRAPHLSRESREEQTRGSFPSFPSFPSTPRVREAEMFRAGVRAVRTELVPNLRRHFLIHTDAYPPDPAECAWSPRRGDEPQFQNPA